MTPVAIAEHISATVEGFLELMNERAKALSMDDTHFETVHGLPPTNGNAGDLTSAHDMAVLAREPPNIPNSSAGVPPRKITYGGQIHSDEYQQTRLPVSRRRWAQNRFPCAGGFQCHSYGAT
jgi:D-alanyl-D-alanine carboxypeptidase